MLLPNEWIENSIETYIYQHTTKSQVIYWVVLLAITATLVALPFIYVDISVQGSGVVRPIAEKAEITSSVTEIVDSVFVREGEQVKKGDVILRFKTANSDYKISYQISRLNDSTCIFTGIPTLIKPMLRGVTYTSRQSVESGLMTAKVCPAWMLLPLYTPENWSTVPATGLRTIYKSLSFTSCFRLEFISL